MEHTPLVDFSPGSAQPHYWCGALCNPKSRIHRYAMAFFICVMTFGSSFCLDNPAALENIFIINLHLTTSQFMSLYSLYSYPNVVLSYVGGFLIDRYIGVRWGAILFASLIFIGQCLFALGASVSSLYLMYISRIIYGIGGESLAVAQNSYASAWFSQTELNFIFGVTLSFSRAGSTVNFNLMHRLYDAIGRAFNVTGGTQLGLTLFAASIMCFASLVCAITLAYFYKRCVVFIV